MTTIQEQIKNDITQAMKNKQPFLRDTLRMIKSVIDNVEKDTLTTLDQSGVESVIMTYKKQLEDSLSYAVKANDQAKIDAIKAEIEIALRYLPQQMTEDEIAAVVISIIYEMEASARNIGNVMKKINPIVKGKADGKLVNAIVTKALKEV